MGRRDSTSYEMGRVAEVVIDRFAQARSGNVIERVFGRAVEAAVGGEL